jgi:dipeptidyl aminopeptidase/acylaminoacyl peptidase
MSAFFPTHSEWGVQTQRLVAQVAYGGADYFDCARTVERIEPGDPTSWQGEWQHLAEEVEQRARAAAAKNQDAAAMRHYFHAGSYYRQSDFFLPGRDARKTELFLKANACFNEGARRHRPTIEPIQVRCGTETYDGYFYVPDRAGRKPIPGVFLIGGADSLAEELFFLVGPELAERGAALLLLDTPGRGSTLRLKNIYARPDYEVPTKAAIDYLVSRSEIDAARIGLMGISVGGYYAPRAAAYEKRVKALVCWGASYDLLADLYVFYPPIRGQMQWILGAKDDAEARAKLATYHLRDAALRIECPALVSHARADTLMNVEGAARLFEAMSSRDKELKIWEPGAGGDVHCNWDSLATVMPYMLDWMMARL